MTLIPTIQVSGDLNSEKVYLTSGIQPPAEEGTVTKQIKTHSEFQSYASGGAIYHMFLNESIDADEKTKMIKKMFSNFPIRYVSLTPYLSVCNSCSKRFTGKRNICSCGSEDLSIWSRPVGYFRPAMRGHISDDLRSADHSFWLSSRLEEFLNRKEIMQNDITEFLDEINSGV